MSHHIDINVNSIVTDSELVLVKIFKKYFPNSLRIMCLFHLKQDLMREAKKLGLFNSKNKKVKSMKQIRNRKKFDMKEYEKMVKNSNKIYHLKFIEDREIMFNPKFSSKNQVKNINDLSSIIKRIKQNQSKEDCSTMFLENSTIRKKSKNFDYLQKSSSNKKLLFNDEQKNSETLEQPNYSKMKTPFKLKNSFK